MILECTECGTRYLVDDTAIGADGRIVRCANCRHSWFQAGPPVLDLVARAEIAPAVAPPLAQAPIATGFTEPDGAPDHDAPDYDVFAHEPPFRPRRNPARRWTMIAVAAVVALLVGVGGILYWRAPGLAGQLFRPDAGTPLRLVSKPVDRHDYNGNEIFAVSGIVLNPTDTRQPVPDIRADLRDAQRRIVYSWVIRPETMELPPRGRVEFNSAKLDVPVSARELALSFAGQPAR